MTQFITIIAGILYVVAIIPYLISLHRKEIRPHPISWLLWTIIGVVNLVFYRQTGATYAQLIAYMSFFLPLIILIFSLRTWQGAFSKTDYFCLCTSLVALIIGIFYNQPILGLALNILLSDFIAFIPTIIKTYKDPKSENISTWLITVIANILTIAVINKWTFAIALLPVYTFIMNGVVLIFSLRRKKLEIQ
jgi:nucleoside permease NupC